MKIRELVLIISIGTMMLCLPNGIDARGVGTSAANFLKIEIGDRPEDQYVFADNPAEKSHILFWDDQLNAYVPENSRALQLGRTWLALYDDESIPTLFNLNNSAGLGYEPKTNRLDLGAGYSSVDSLSIEKQASAYQGATVWVNEDIVLNAFVIAPSVETRIEGGIQGAYKLNKTISVGGKYIYSSYLNMGNEEYRDCLWALSGAVDFPGIIGENSKLELGVSIEGNDTLLSTRLLSGEADTGSSVKPIFVSQQTILQQQNSWIVGLVFEYLYEEISFLQSNDSLGYFENNMLLISAMAKYKVFNDKDFKTNAGLLFNQTTNLLFQENNYISKGAIGLGMEAWQWLGITAELGTDFSPRRDYFGDDNIDWGLGIEVKPWDTVAFRFGARHRNITMLTAGVGLKLFKRVDLDIFGYSLGDLGSRYSVSAKILL